MSLKVGRRKVLFCSLISRKGATEYRNLPAAGRGRHGGWGKCAPPPAAVRRGQGEEREDGERQWGRRYNEARSAQP